MMPTVKKSVPNKIKLLKKSFKKMFYSKRLVITFTTNLVSFLTILHYTLADQINLVDQIKVDPKFCKFLKTISKLL
jgi:hypothetical protein